MLHALPCHPCTFVSNMIAMKTKSFLLLAMSLMLSSAWAQQTEVIDLATLQQRARASNRQMLAGQQDIRQAEGRVKQTDAAFLPNVSISHTGMSTNNPLNAFGTKLNQAIVTQADFNPVLLNNPDDIQDFATRLEVQQPILNLDAIYQRKAAQAQLLAVSYQQGRSVEHLMLRVEQTYLYLQLAYETVEVLETAKESILATQSVAQNAFNEGLLQRADLLDIEVKLLEVDNQLIQAKSKINNLSDELTVLAADTTNHLYLPAHALSMNLDQVAEPYLPNNRKDLLAQEARMESFSQKAKADRMSILPQLNAFGTYELHDEDVFQGSVRTYMVGASLQWNIFQGNRRVGKKISSEAQYNQARLSYNQYQEESKAELQKAFRSLNDAKNSISLNEKAIAQAQEALRVRRDRLAQGLEKSNDVLQTETLVAQQKLAYYQNVVAYNFTKAYIEFLTQE